MIYRVILTVNGKYDRTFYRIRTKETAFRHLNRLKEENKVLFPKRHIKTPKSITPVVYQLCVTKPTEKTDTFRHLRDKYGKTYIEKPLGDWTILHSVDYDYEERFKLFGNDQMCTINDVLQKLMSGAYKKNMVKQIIVVHNKLIIYNEDQFDMVMCKCIEDAQRLHYALYRMSRKQKIKSLLFMGIATQATISQLYQIIHQKTGWAMTRIRRRTTRP